MKQLNMSIYTGIEGENKVMCTAVFETHELAVSFHEDLAELCNKHSIPLKTFRRTWYPLIGSNASRN